jgi:hypothetical protein
MQTWLSKCGPYAVRKFPCRAYAGPVNMAAPRTGIMHTTEGKGLPLGEFRTHYAPHFTLNDKEIVQLLPIGLSGAATRAHNNIAICQIEVVGFSREELWFPDDETAKRLAAVMATMHHLFGVPLSRPFANGEWGKAGDNPNRHAGHFGKTAGWYSHGDMPLPDAHWDAGNLDWTRLFEMARSFEPQPEEPADDVGHPDAAG